jgi:hypothetical protein
MRAEYAVGTARAKPGERATGAIQGIVEEELTA